MLEESSTDEVRHIPVLADEVLELLDPQPGQVVVDATTGVGGHARLLAEKLGASGQIDRPGSGSGDAWLWPRSALAGLNRSLWYTATSKICRKSCKSCNAGPVDAILADLGFCSDQMADPQRGLSFQQDGPLDMRLDRTRGEPASVMVQRLREKELADIFWHYGEERYSRRVARKIVEVRKTARLTTTGQLADLVRSCVPRSPATAPHRPGHARLPGPADRGQ